MSRQETRVSGECAEEDWSDSRGEPLGEDVTDERILGLEDDHGGAVLIESG